MSLNLIGKVVINVPKKIDQVVNDYANPEHTAHERREAAWCTSVTEASKMVNMSATVNGVDLFDLP
jgi:hypothetical protein